MANIRATSNVDRAIALLASRPHGVFTAADLRHEGVGRSSLVDRVRIGALFRLHHGVYTIVPPRLLRIEGRWLAAVLACGLGAVLSHTAAAALWEMRAIPSGPIHITVPTTAGRRRRPGLVVHRSSTLLASQTTIRRAIPVTNPARTLSDLRRLLSPQAWADVERRAIDCGRIGHPEPAESELERRFRALCRRHRLPQPVAQQQVGPYTVDFVWPDRRVIVELDGFRTHGRRSGFESDRSRDAWLTARGYRVVRFTWRQLHDEPAMVIATLRRLLG